MRGHTYALSNIVNEVSYHLGDVGYPVKIMIPCQLMKCFTPSVVPFYN